VWIVLKEGTKPLGLIEQIAERTPDTTKVTSTTLALMIKYQVPGDKVFFDKGGGGKPHADRLRLKGHNVHTIAFGEATTAAEMKRGMTTFDERSKRAEMRYVYKNRRAEMYGILMNLLNPDENPDGFGIPRHLVELRRQMAPIPLLYDEEGTIYMMPKRKTPGSTKECLTDLIGCSPDELDSLVLAVYGLKYKPAQNVAGAMW
jgi:hypothetical protein